MEDNNFEKSSISDKLDLSSKSKLWKIIFIISMALFFFTLCFLGYLLFNKIKGSISTQGEELALNSTSSVQSVVTSCEGCLPRKIDGKLVLPEYSDSRPMAVVIDNHYLARPSHSISKASVVFEVEAEGGITRYLGIFDSSDDISSIGPVRSARTYFVEWAAGFDALFMHCGGSPDALVRVLQEKMLDLDEYYNADYYWREKSMIAPHNILSSTKSSRDYLEKRGRKYNGLDAWNFISKNDFIKSDQKNAAKIRINFKPGYEAEWRYNQAIDKYERYLSDERHFDAANDSIDASNVVVAFSTFEVSDEKLRLKIKVIGSGKAYLCHLGVCTEGVWKKEKTNSMIRFYDLDGLELSLLSGNTWIEFIDPNRTSHIIE